MVEYWNGALAAIPCAIGDFKGGGVRGGIGPSC